MVPRQSGLGHRARLHDSRPHHHASLRIIAHHRASRNRIIAHHVTASQHSVSQQTTAQHVASFDPHNQCATAPKARTQVLSRTCIFPNQLPPVPYLRAKVQKPERPFHRGCFLMHPHSVHTTSKTGIIRQNYTSLSIHVRRRARGVVPDHSRPARCLLAPLPAATPHVDQRIRPERQAVVEQLLPTHDACVLFGIARSAVGRRVRARARTKVRRRVRARTGVTCLASIARTHTRRVGLG